MGRKIALALLRFFFFFFFPLRSMNVKALSLGKILPFIFLAVWTPEGYSLLSPFRDARHLFLSPGLP